MTPGLQAYWSGVSLGPLAPPPGKSVHCCLCHTTAGGGFGGPLAEAHHALVSSSFLGLHSETQLRMPLLSDSSIHP